MSRKPVALLALLHCLRVSPAFAADLIGTVVSVLDGDTIEALHNQYPERIRISGIDCPEKGQAYGHTFNTGVCGCQPQSLTYPV